jgi:hypothetical protein
MNMVPAAPRWTGPTVTLSQSLRRRTSCGWKVQGFQDTWPAPFVTPEPIAFVRGLPFAVLRRHLAPGQASPYHGEDTAQDHPVVMAGPARRGLLWWEKRADALPGSIAERPLYRGKAKDGLRGRSSGQSPSSGSWQPPCGVAAGCPGLVSAPPVGPRELEYLLLVRLAQRPGYAADFGHGQGNAGAPRPPFSALASAAKAR